METFGFIIILGIFYFLPMIIALAKKCDNTAQIVLFSLLLGWIPLVTIVCIIWAIVGTTEQKQVARGKMLAQAIADAQHSAA